MKKTIELTDAQRAEAEAQLRRGRFNLLQGQPFIAYGAMKLTLQETSEIPTLMTDGQKIYYNPAYVLTTETPDVMYWDFAVSEVVHETLHAFFGHCKDWAAQGYDPALVNIAQDYVVNLHVKDMGYPIHPNWLFDERFRTMNWYQVYDILKSEQQKQPGQSMPGRTCEVRPQPPEPADGQAEDGQGQGDLKGADGKPAPPSPGDGPASKAEADAYNQWDRIAVEAAKFAQGMGNVPAFADQLVAEIMRPRIHWSSYVSRFMRRASKGDYSFVRPNKRYLHRGLILPSNTTRRGQVVVGVDTSGSCLHLLSQFFGELWGIAKAVKVDMDVIECDTHPAGWRLRRPEDVTKIKHQGGGGTDFRPVFEAVREGRCEGLADHAGRIRRPDLLIFLTDGEGTYPDAPPPYPVLWCIPGAERLSDHWKPPFGMIVDLPTDGGNS